MNLLLTEDIKFILTQALQDYYYTCATAPLSPEDKKRLDDARIWLEQQQPLRKEITDAHNNP